MTTLAIRNVLAPVSAADVALTPFYPTSGAIVAGVLKAAPGNLYGLAVVNAVAAVTWLQFFDKATTPTLGTNVLFALPIPAGANTGTLIIPASALPLSAFAAGIAWGAATTPGGSSAPATAPNGMAFID